MARGINKAALIELYLSGMSVPEVADETGFGRSTVYYHLKKHGVLRSRTEGVKNAAKKGRLGSGLRGKKRVFSDNHKEAISKSRIEWGRSFAKGTSIKPNGYVVFTVGDNKGKAVHRVMMEKKIGRKLLSNEHVHHKDGNRSNNDICNLEVMNISKHMSHHAKENYQSRRRNSDGTWS